jgi:glycerophosphoryl diester phosphodiesterase
MSSAVTSFRNVGYRGAPALVPPGSTVASLKRGVEVGANMLMVDVRRTRDDILVIDRDAVRLIDDREVHLREWSYSEWRRRTAESDAPITRLDEAFSIAMGARAGLILDLRETGTEALVARAIRQSGLALSGMLVASPDETSRAIIRGLDPRIPLAHVLKAEDASKVNAKLLGEIDTRAVTWHHRLITPAVVKVLHAREIQVYAGPVDLSEDMRRMRDVCGVDGIITNFPDVLSGLSR